MALDCGAALALGASWGALRFLEELVLRLAVLSFSLATLPAISPIANEELEAVGINFHARLEADAKISEIHLVLLRVRQEEGEVACDGEEEVVLEGR